MNYRSLCRRPGRLLLALGLIGWLSAAPGRAAPPQRVDVRQPVQKNVTAAEDFVGRLAAVATVDLRARVTGYLQKVHFKAGSRVKKGELLFEIDPRIYEAALDKAKADLVLAEAELKSRDAEFQRARKLLATKAISQEDFDKFNHDRTKAAAAVKVAQVNVTAAKLHLDFTRVTAPISGKIGRPQLTPGNLVLADTTLLATIVSEDPMYVDFAMDERTLLRYRRLLRSEQIKEGGPIDVGLADEKDFPRKGRLESLDNRVNPVRGTVRVRGVIANADRLLLPGMCVRVRMPLGKPYKALLVPEEAVAAEQGKKYVFVVNAKDVVECRAVKLGKQYDQLRVIEEGLKRDEWVVVRGFTGLRPGDTVKPRRLTEALPPKK